MGEFILIVLMLVFFGASVWLSASKGIEAYVRGKELEAEALEVAERIEG